MIEKDTSGSQVSSAAEECKRSVQLQAENQMVVPDSQKGEFQKESK